MDAVGIEAADRHNLFHLRNADAAGRRHRLVKVAGGLAEDEVAALVGLPALDDAEIGADSALQDVSLAVEFLMLLALGDDGSDPGLGIEAGDPGAAGSAAFGERPLRAEFDLELAGQILPLELLVLADVGGDHLLHLAGPQELAEALIVDAGIVGRDGEVLDAAVPDRVDQPLRNAA